MALRNLSPAEIEKLASRKGVSRTAVENFLGTVDVNPDASAAYQNLNADARAYKWNAPTHKAISDGISLARKAV